MKHFEIKKTGKPDCSPLMQNGLTAAEQVEKMRAMYSNMVHCSDCFDEDEDDAEKTEPFFTTPQRNLTEEELSLLTPRLRTRYIIQLFVDNLNNPLAHDRSN
jgi:hypothetical protein